MNSDFFDTSPTVNNNVRLDQQPDEIWLYSLKTNKSN